MKNSKLSALLTAAGFCVFIGAFFLLNTFVPDRAFSDRENRTLQATPAFSADALFSGKFTAEIDTYLADQFVWRDGFVGVKSLSEKALGKRENNGVYLLNGGALAEKFESPDQKQIDKNVKAVSKFTENAGVPVYFTLIPSPVEIRRNELPFGAPNADQKRLTAEIYNNTKGINQVDTYSALSEKAGEHIYYNTDHHWTPLGAYYGYAAAVSAMGKTAAPLGTPTRVTDEFYGTAYRKAGTYYLAADAIDVFAKPNATAQIFDGEGWKDAPIYDESWLPKVDKYNYFLGGNQPLMVLKGQAQGGKLLIIKDSYANSEAPYFLENFSEVHLFDLRFNKESVSEYIKEAGIDTVLISYSVPNFTADTNLTFLH